MEKEIYNHPKIFLFEEDSHWENQYSSPFFLGSQPQSQFNNFYNLFQDYSSNTLNEKENFPIRELNYSIQNHQNQNQKKTNVIQICKNDEFEIRNSHNNTSKDEKTEEKKSFIDDGNLSKEESAKKNIQGKKIERSFHKNINKCTYTYSFHCEHTGCGNSFKTLKLKMSHHDLLNKNCKEDTLIILNSINKARNLIKRIKRKSQNENEIINNLNKMIQSKLNHIQHKDYVNNILNINLP